MRPTRNLFLAGLSIVAFTIACAQSLQADPVDDARLRFEALASQVGYSCNIDFDCTSPLRCLDNACAQPAAMTGEADETTPLFFEPPTMTGFPFKEGLSSASTAV